MLTLTLAIWGFDKLIKYNSKINGVSSTLHSSIPEDLIGPKVITTFSGVLTGYGPDCKGCGGTVYGGKNGGRLDVRNGNIYYQDDTYGEVRIVAADRKYSYGTIVRITAPNVSKTPILAIVLDRGNANIVKGNLFDLLFESETKTNNIGKQRDVKYEILRYGFKDYF
jgi:3D (Asp-Asp-Asp) domain-containing protein